MKKELAAAAMAAVMLILAGCAGNEGEDITGTSAVTGEAGADNEVMSLAESMAESMFESRMEDMTETTAESTAAVTALKSAETTEEVTATEVTENSKSISHTFCRMSEEESRTVTIESDVFPFDCEEMEIIVDTEYPYYNDVTPYDRIDLANLKNYPVLKKLSIADGNAQGSAFIELINCESTAELKNLEEIRLCRLVWDDDWLSEIDPLRTLAISSCLNYNGKDLKNLAQVERLTLFRCGITEVEFINGMDSLDELVLDHTCLSNEGFDEVEKNYSIKRLTLQENVLSVGYKLTDIRGVAVLSGLEYLYISETDLVDGDKQVVELQKELPDCEIIYEKGIIIKNGGIDNE